MSDFNGEGDQETVRVVQEASGALMNMASILGQVGFAGAQVYFAVNQGVIGLLRMLRLCMQQVGCGSIRSGQASSTPQ